MVSKVEYFRKEYNDWFLLTYVTPKKPGYLANNERDGTREIIVVNCHADDSQTDVLLAPKESIITENGLMFPSDTLPKVLAVLTRNDPPYELSLTPDWSDEMVSYDISHI
jgi:hypothetical protein